MVNVDHDHLVVLVGRVLANPVGVENPQTLEPAATSPHRDTVDDVSLFGFVSKPARLVRPSWPGSTVHLGKLTILPAPNAEQVAHNIALLLPVQLRDVLVRTHP